MRIVAFILIYAFVGGYAFADVFYVDAINGHANNDCRSPDFPCVSIQQAVENSIPGDQILVAKGVYTHDPRFDCAAVVCVNATALTLLGGYDPGTWLTANPASNTTIIDGENLHRGVSVFHFGMPTSLRMEGFTIRRGLARGENGENLGGGLKASNADITLRQIIFEDNKALGIDTLADTGNTGAGGGVYIVSCPVSPPDSSGFQTGTLVRPNVILEQLVFRRNVAQGGQGAVVGGNALAGGLFIHRASLLAKDIDFFDNRALAGSSTGRGYLSATQHADALGGGAAIMFATKGTINSITVANNEAQGGAGKDKGGLAYGGGLFFEGRLDSQIVIPGCPANSMPESPINDVFIADAEFINNLSIGGTGEIAGNGIGGALNAFRAYLTMDRFQMIGNQALTGFGDDGAGSGGAIFIEDSPRLPDGRMSYFKNAIIAQNEAIGAKGGGGGIRVLGSDVKIEHATIADNIIPADGGVRSPGQAILAGPRPQAGVQVTSQVIVNYSIIANHSVATKVAIHALPDSSIELYKGLFAGNNINTSIDHPFSGTILGESSMLEAIDAGFKESDSLPYRLASSSIAIDQAIGSSTYKDFENQTRGPAIDIGADEWCSTIVENINISNKTYVGNIKEQACNTVSVTASEIESGASVVFQAGVALGFGNEFRIKKGADALVRLSLP